MAGGHGDERTWDAFSEIDRNAKPVIIGTIAKDSEPEE
jgi:hypothetical protein